MDKLTVALPKGRLQDDVLALFAGTGIVVDCADDRRLILEDRAGAVRFVLAKPVDVPTYVEYGAADLGIVGEDVLRESARQVYEPLGLGLGRCRLVLAGFPQARERNLRLETNLRVASKYPRLARDYFQRQGISAEIIPLGGSIELAPTVGLADLLVDIVQTGRTLEENGLVILDTIMASQAMLIVNRAAHRLRFREISDIIQRLAAQVARHQGEG